MIVDIVRNVGPSHDPGIGRIPEQLNPYEPIAYKLPADRDNVGPSHDPGIGRIPEQLNPYEPIAYKLPADRES